MRELKNVDPYLQFAPRACKIKRVKEEASNIKSFYLQYAGQKPSPGQFFMIWAPGGEEIPISASGFEQNILRLTVAAVGKTTELMMNLKKGDILLLRGPFGRGFSLNGYKKVMLVAGGYGASPLIYALKSIRENRGECWYVVGAKKSEELLFIHEAKKLGAKVEVATEDGSAGYKGLVTELFENLLNKIKPECVLTCGPEMMMKKVLEIALKKGIHVQASLERYMKCGFGICGSCVLDPVGLRVCIDGPVFCARELLNTDFGKFSRDAAGRRVPI